MTLPKNTALACEYAVSTVGSIHEQATALCVADSETNRRKTMTTLIRKIDVFIKLPPNGPELSCGADNYTNVLSAMRSNIGGARNYPRFSRQLERLVRPLVCSLLKNLLNQLISLKARFGATTETTEHCCSR